MDCSLLGSSVPGISQARILEWVAISFSRGSSRPRDLISSTAGGLLHCRGKTQSLGKHSTHIISFNLHNNPTREAWNALGLWMRLREGQWNTSISIIRWLTQQLSPCAFILNPCAILLLMVEQERQVVSWKEMESGDLLAEWVQLTYVFCGQTWVRCSVLSWTSADLILSHYINAVENPAITMWMATPKFGFL